MDVSNFVYLFAPSGITETAVGLPDATQSDPGYIAGLSSLTFRRLAVDDLREAERGVSIRAP